MIDQIKEKFENIIKTDSVIFKESYRVILSIDDKNLVEKFIDELISKQKEKYSKSYSDIDDTVFWISLNEYQISLVSFYDMISLMIVKGE